MSEAVNNVFVLMPFEAAFTDVYEHLIKAPLEEVGFVVSRADSLFNQQQILKDVVKGIADATLIVADVTDLNENVLYELGLAHALGKRTVMITQKLEELPFDLRPYRANEYSTQFNEANALKVLLTGIGTSVLSGEATFSNPVQDFAPYALNRTTQVNLVPQTGDQVPPASQPLTSPRAQTLNDDSDDAPGLLERFLAMERGGEEAARLAETIAEYTTAIGNKLGEHTERLNRARANLGDRATGAQLAIAKDAAQDLEAYADLIQPMSSKLRSALSDVAGAADAFAREGAIDDDQDEAAAVKMLDDLREAEAGMADGRGGIEAFAQTMLEFPNMERSLRRATKRTAAVVLGAADEIQTAESEFARARGLLQERLAAYRSSRP